MQLYDLIIIGGGQSALACAYFLRRSGLDYLILDDQPRAGGAWRHAWDSLTLFSPAQYSSLPGWMMPPSEHEYPTKAEVIAYLKAYQARYGIRIHHGAKVQTVAKSQDFFTVETNGGSYLSKTIISATGTWQKPFVPPLDGREIYEGIQLHSAHYSNPDAFKGMKVLVVGTGNSGAQILAEVSKVATTVWAAQKPPEFLPDDVDGRVLFDVASAKYHAMKEGGTIDPASYNLGNVVMVPPVREARSRGVLTARPTFLAMYEQGVLWPDGSREEFGAVIWCTGFGFATDHLGSLGIVEEKGKVACEATRSIAVDGLWLVGYGGFTGFASATLIGVGRSARQTVKEVTDHLKIDS
jgi:putative flavoprotein involved in K+ transport